MVNYDTVLVRYGELSTKGKNKKDFIRRLDSNIKWILRDHEKLEYRRTYDRIYIKLNGEDQTVIREKLGKVFGISSFSFTEKIPSDLEEIKKTCLRIASESPAKTFKIITRRHDKTFPLNSDGINRAVAGVILHETDKKVDVHDPELAISIEVRRQDTYIMSEKIPGLGGYPAGINGKCLLLLSGGIDSPVAAFELMKRGIQVEAIHYASPPYTSDQARQKVLDLASIVSIYQGRMKVHVVDFTKLQLEIYKAAGDPYAITLMRRMMYRIAEEVAKAEGCICLGTGESVGQVASQTLESIACINETIRIPVLRPLVCMDKIEIIDIARRIGTYETSILPFEDCCTIFDPKNPVTKPVSEKAQQYEARFGWPELVNECVATRNTVTVRPGRKEEEELFL